MHNTKYVQNAIQPLIGSFNIKSAILQYVHFWLGLQYILDDITNKRNVTELSILDTKSDKNRTTVNIVTCR